MRRALAISALLLAACASRFTPPSPPATALTAGDATLDVDAAHGTLTLVRAGSARLSFALDSFQLGTLPAPLDLRNASYDPYWLEPAAPGAQAVVPQGLQWRSATKLTVLSSSPTAWTLQLDFPNATATLVLEAAAPGRFSASWIPTSTSSSETIAWFRLRAHVDASEQFYGLGEWGDSVAQRGEQRPMQIEIDQLESGYNEAHAPVPLVIGTRGWGLFVQSRRAGLFDVARKDPQIVEVTFAAGPHPADGLAFHLFAADPIDVTGLYDQVAGFPKLPAPWALGPVMWRNETSGQAQVADDVAQLRTRHLAASGYWLDRPYATGVNTFDFDPAKFPDAGAMIDGLQAAGLRVAVWHTPYVAPAGKSEASPELNQDAESSGYFPPQDGFALLNPWGKPIDFTNGEALAWWQSLLHRYTDVGVEGFKLDFAEDVQLGVSGVRDPWKFADGSDERTMQSQYQLLYHQAYSQLLPTSGGFLLCRTGRWGDQVNGCVLWPGDLEANYSNERDAFGDGGYSVGGLPAAMVKGLGLGASGFPFYASDTGGYRNAPGTLELFLRWTEMSSVGSAMEVGNAASTMPWEIATDATSLAVYQRYASLAMRLFPYKWTYAQKLASDGRALERPLGLAYPQMHEQPSDELLLGDSIFAAPVLSAGATTRDVLVPPGTWLDWWTGAPLTGESHATVPAPLDTLPLFIRAGGLVPMLRPEIDTLAPSTLAGVESYANDPGLLFVRVAPSSDATSFTLFDGTQLAQQRASDGQHVSVQPASAPLFRGVIFEVIATSKPSSVSGLSEAASVDSLRSAPGWFWESATGGTLWVRLDSGQAFAK